MDPSIIPSSIVEGIRFPGFSGDAAREALNYLPKKDDVVIVTYPKCGTNWTKNIVANLRHYGELKDGLQIHQVCPFLEMTGTKSLKEEGGNSFMCHLPFDKKRWNAEAKYIFVVRNPKDACVSFYHHYQAMVANAPNAPKEPIEWFDTFTEMFMNGECFYGDFFDFLRGWYAMKDEPNVLTIVYEDMKLDAEGYIVKIGEFIGGKAAEVVKDPEMVRHVVEVTSFDSMKKSNAQLMEKMKELNLAKGGKPIGAPPVRKGIVGDWKNHFSPELAEKFQRYIEAKPENKIIMEFFEGKC